jgi:hypothetical protein
MKSKVYHRDPVKSTYFFPAQSPDEPTFTLVAEVDSENLEEIFELTNHIEHSWTQNKKVTVIANNSVRSTSVGDLVLINGKYFVCKDTGWSVTTDFHAA